MAGNWGTGGEWIITLSPPPPMTDKLRAIETNFWRRVQKTPTCWLWTGRLDACGYGCVYIRDGERRRRIQAHRVAYALHHGALPGADQVVRHRCHDPRCVRASHLAIGTHADNVQNRVRAGHCARGERNGRAKLSAEDVLHIRARLARGESCSSVAREFALDRKTISALRARKTWRHLPPETDSDRDIQ